MRRRRWIASTLLGVLGCLPRPCPEGSTAKVWLQLKAYDANDTSRRSPRFLAYQNILSAGNRIRASMWTDRPAYLYFLSCDSRSAERLLPAGDLQSAELSPAHTPQTVPPDPTHEQEALPGLTRLVLLSSAQPLDLATCKREVTAACKPLWAHGPGDRALVDKLLQSACGDAAPGSLKRGSGDDSQAESTPAPPPPPPPPPVRGGRAGRPGSLERHGEVVTLTSCQSRNGVVSLQVDLCVGVQCPEARGG